MKCPLCAYDLHPQTVSGASGKKVAIEHCGQCGGTWFDPFETVGIPYHEMVRIAADTVKPKTPSFSTADQHCPRCHQVLTLMHSDVVPAGVSFYRCGKCRGIWATQRKAPQLDTPTPLSTDTSAHEHRPWSVAFVPTLALVMLALTTVLTVSSVRNQESRIRAAAQVDAFSLRPTSATSVLIGFHTTVPMTSTITIVTDTGYALTQDISTTYTSNHTTVLTQLPPQTSFKYEITLTDKEGIIQSLTGTFTTP